ncbi:MAG: thioredoxin [Eubacteriales bacterium]|nr:thioredoxin [Eubacteriales bacterium]
MELILTSENFDAAIRNTDKPVLVDFFATWCGPCRMLAPVLEQLAAEHADTLTVGKVNVDDAPDLAARFGVVSIPTLILFRAGKAVKKTVGYSPLPELLRWVEG